MKKILTMLTSFGLISTSSVLVVSCKTDGSNKKIKEPRRVPDSKTNKKENKKENEASKSRNEIPQSDESKKEDEKHTSSTSSTYINKDNNILSSIEDESVFIKKYYEWWSKTKKDSIPHFINPNEPNEILVLGYTKEGNKGYKLNQIPENINKVPNKLPKLITSLEGAFKNNNNAVINGLENWDTTNVKNMYQTFFGAKNFNQDISNWNTDNVDNMSYMFAYAGSFNKDLSKWKATKSPFPTGFANESGFKDNKKLWPQFRNKN
ncbi:BspA family leucine-rich repeat surface protein [Mycoplasma feriruminatoris]|uniref:BspA family leucine-rich repeat surface protein n=1 Tax=Mycoplasma feriruminatoris TaxID=1179777 RepID=UPI00241D5F19|nr:BspA family leucine-rich repeat surface protein [Mycoplasma feriruminatoris]WFQ92034.1 hypothetical protein MFERI14815_00650 [Mycoplasma feriruminatoris]WFQ94561.1 hypothetical protein MFERI15220_00642 [Mycoplasma feriruminatoris]